MRPSNYVFLLPSSLQMPVIAMMTAVLAILLALLSTASSTAAVRYFQGRYDPGIIVQMFEWDWVSIGQECTEFLGPAGYSSVQVSPPQEHIAGPQWWTSYQPVSHKIISKRGTRAQFASMVQTCNSAGVGVLADLILNHMSAHQSESGVGGTEFTHYSYPGYDYNNFHHCGLVPKDIIRNYDDRLEVQTCELLGLADLDTGSDYVRNTLASYANDLLSLGVRGFRLDACKHISATDLAVIAKRFLGKPYLTLEVIYGVGEPIQPSEYVGIGDVQEFRYTTTLRDAFLHDGIASLRNIPRSDWVDTSVATVFVSNHDTERNGHSLNYMSLSNMYLLAHVFMLTWPYGTPTVLSSYKFTNTDEGAPMKGSGACVGSGGSSGWLCQHRHPYIANLIPFYKAVSGKVNNFVAGSNQQIAYGRGSTGFVIINNDDAMWSGTFSTSLPDGMYCDIIGGYSEGGTCLGAWFGVTNGVFQAAISARSAIALYTGARSELQRPALCMYAAPDPMVISDRMLSLNSGEGRTAKNGAAQGVGGGETSTNLTRTVGGNELGAVLMPQVEAELASSVKQADSQVDVVHTPFPVSQLYARKNLL